MSLNYLFCYNTRNFRLQIFPSVLLWLLLIMSCCFIALFTSFLFLLVFVMFSSRVILKSPALFILYCTTVNFLFLYILIYVHHSIVILLIVIGTFPLKSILFDIHEAL